MGVFSTQNLSQKHFGPIYVNQENNLYCTACVCVCACVHACVHACVGVGVGGWVGDPS